MRRLRQSRVKTYFAKPRTLEYDSEGVPSEEFGAPFVIKGYLWPATSTRQVEEYGDRISNIANMRIEGEYEIVLQGRVPAVVFKNGNVLMANDGVCVYANCCEDPDYRVIAITEYYPLKLEVERRG